MSVIYITEYTNYCKCNIALIMDIYKKKRIDATDQQYCLFYSIQFSSLPDACMTGHATQLDLFNCVHLDVLVL